jgi:hypothetical protein
MTSETPSALPRGRAPASGRRTIRQYYRVMGTPTTVDLADIFPMLKKRGKGRKAKQIFSSDGRRAIRTNHPELR